MNSDDTTKYKLNMFYKASIHEHFKSSDSSLDHHCKANISSHEPVSNIQIVRNILNNLPT